MAKIYETKEDFERDKLTEQAKDLRLTEERQNASSLGWLGLSFFADALRLTIPRTRDWIGYVSSGLLAGGIVQFIRSWMTGNKAHALELQRDRMGPGVVILPADMPKEEAKDCGCHLKKHAAHGPTSLLEQAERTGFPPNLSK